MVKAQKNNPDKNQINQGTQNNKNSQEAIYLSSFKVQLKCTILCLGAINMGYNAGVLNLAQPKLNIEYGLEQNLALYKGILGGCLLLGCGLGCILCGSILQKLGERKTLIYCDIMIICLVSFYAISEYWVAVCVRFTLGIVLGINLSSIPVFIKNVTPVALLGKTGSFLSLYVAFGMCVSVSIGQGFPNDEQKLEDQNQVFWRFVLMFPIIPALARILCQVFIYKLDTAIFYIRRDQEENAILALRQTYKEDYIQQQYQILCEQVQKEKNQKQDSLKSIFSKENRSRSSQAFILQIMYQLTGIMSIMLYSKTIFEKTTGDKELAKLMAVISALCQALPSFYSGQVTQKFGRRQLLLWGNALLGINQLVLGIICHVNKENLDKEDVSQFSSIFTITLIMIFCIIFRLTTGQIIYTYVAEIVSPKINGISISLQFFTAFLVGLLFPISVEEFGIHVLFYFFASCMIVGYIYMIPRVKETKGLIQKDIYALFDSNSDDYKNNIKENQYTVKEDQQKINFNKQNQQQIQEEDILKTELQVPAKQQN